MAIIDDTAVSESLHISEKRYQDDKEFPTKGDFLSRRKSN
jgi:hypothetical protein